MEKRLTKGSSPVLGGVVSGFAEYFNVDPLPLRLLTVALMFLNIFIGFAYIVAWIVMPDYPGETGTAYDRTKSGLIIAGLGVLLLARNFFPQLSFTVIAALALIGLGVYLIVKK